MILLTAILAAILAPIVIVTAFFAIEVLAGLRPLRPLASVDGADRVVVVIIPAHDEQAVIGQTVSELRNDSGGAVRILVVADNCTDRTQEVAASAGAEVIIRNDLGRRGKGFALAAARDHLRSAPPAIVMIVDADCRFEKGSARILAASALASGRPCQSVNLLSPDIAGPAMVQISTFAFMIKNLVRQRGLYRLAGRAHLTGTGVALPWRIFETADLGGANIVEDLALGLELSRRASPPMLVEEARIWSPPASGSGTLKQRRRWEGGFLSTSLRMGPRILASSVRSGDLRGLLAGLDLCVPPLALLALMNAGAIALALIAAALGTSAWPLIVDLATGLLAFAALSLAWSREGRRFASAGTLLRLPLYVLWKLPMYAGLARRGAPKEWLRTGR